MPFVVHQSFWSSLQDHFAASAKIVAFDYTHQHYLLFVSAKFEF